MSTLIGLGGSLSGDCVGGPVLGGWCGLLVSFSCPMNFFLLCELNLVFGKSFQTSRCSLVYVSEVSFMRVDYWALGVDLDFGS